MGELLSKFTNSVNDCDLNTTPASKTTKNKLFKRIIDPRSPTFDSDGFNRTPVTIRVAAAKNGIKSNDTPITNKIENNEIIKSNDDTPIGKTELKLNDDSVIEQ